jgi:hypothetical protein
MQIVFYVVAIVVGGLFSYMVFGFSLLSGERFATYVGVFLGLAHLVTIIFSVKMAHKKNIGLAVLSLVSPAFLALACLTAFATSQNLFKADASDPQFLAACEHTGVQILHAPIARVTSIGLDWEPGSGSVPKTVYRMGSGRQLDGFENSIPFQEMIVDSSIADVLVTHQVSDPEEEKMAPRYQKLIVYTLTATDRRDGIKLATMTFAVDMAKRQGCGANTKNTIDLDEFLRQATAFQGQNASPRQLPPIRDVALEVLETETYSPVRKISGDEWQNLAWDARRTDLCQKMAPQVSRGSLQRRFASDSTGTKRMVNRQGFMLCDSEGIWTGTYAGEFGKGKVELEKYTPDGELLYMVKFDEPSEIDWYHGGILNPTLRSQDGYLVFEWWNNNQSGSDREINRRMKVRFQEPLAIISPSR